MSSDVRAKSASTGSLVRYSIALAAVAAAALLRQSLQHFCGHELPPFILFYPAVMLVALFGGFRPGVLATLLSALIVDYTILEPRGSLTIASAADAIALSVFIGMGLFMCIVADRYRASQHRIANFKRELALRDEQEKLLQASQAIKRQAEMLRLSFDAIVSWQLDGTIESWNRGAEQLYGYSEGEALGAVTHKLLKTSHPQPWPKIEAELRERGYWSGELCHITKDGRELTVATRHQLIVGTDGVERVLETNRDITERKQAEAQLQKLNRTLNALSDSNQALLRSASESEFLQQVCNIVKDDCGHAMVWIGFAEDDKDKSVRPVAHAGFEEGYLETLRITWSDGERGRGPTGTAIRTGQRSRCRNMLRDPAFLPWRDEAIKRGYAASLVLPLMQEDKAFGAITIYSREPDAFAEDEVNLLAELADDLAYGITTLRLRTAHAQAEKALQESEQRFRLALTNAPVSVAVQDRDLVYRWAYNQRSRQADEIIGKTDADLFAPEDIPTILAAKHRVLRTGTPLNVQHWVTSNGQRLFLDLYYEPTRDSAGEVTGIGIAVVDLTEKKQIEDALRASETKYRDLSESIPTLLWATDAKGVTTHHNRRWHEYTGQSLEQGAGDSWKAIVYPGDIERVAKRWAHCIRTGEDYAIEYRIRRASDGTYRWHSVQATLSKDEQGNPLGWFGTLLDIHDRVQAEELLRLSEEKLSKAFATNPAAIVITRLADGVFLDANSAFGAMFGYSREEVIGTSATQFWPVLQNRAERVQQLLEKGSYTGQEQIMLRRSGEQFVALGSAAVLDVAGEQLIISTWLDISDRKKAESRLTRFYETDLFAILYWTIDGGVIDVNNKFLEMTGYTRDDLQAGRLNWAQMTPPEYFPMDEDARRQIRETGVHLPYEKEFIRKDGTRIWGLFSAAAWEDNRNEGVSFILDITERKRVDAAAARLAAIVESSGDAIISEDLNGIILSWNRSAELLFGYSAEEAIGRSITLIIPPIRKNEELDFLNRLRQNECVNHYATIRMAKSGRYIDVSVTLSPVRDASGSFTSISKIVRDITERKRAEEALRESEERWATTLQSIGDAVISTDSSGNIQFMNNVAQRLTGWSISDAKGLDLTVVFNIINEASRIKPESPVAKVLRSGDVVGLANHTALVQRDGTEIPIEDSAAPILNRSGQIEGVVLVFHDVLEQRNAEKALRTSDRLATTGRLAATIAHEIHNPLDAIGNLLYIIDHDTQEENTRQLATMAARELGRVTQMTRRMLTFQRESAKPISVDIKEVLATVIELYERKITAEKIQLDQQIDIEGHIFAQPGELRQIFANLIGNAIEALAPRNSSPATEPANQPATERANQRRIILRAYSSRDRFDHRPGVRILVADNGPGIPNDVRARIFEPFFTTKGESGTGLGLWIASDMLQKYDGVMKVKSSTRPNHSGTCFSVFLPFQPSSASEPVPAESAETSESISSAADPQTQTH
jgi:PAS domain S-box-containing protein